MYEYTIGYNFLLLGKDNLHWIVNWSWPIFTLTKDHMDQEMVTNKTTFVMGDFKEKDNSNDPCDYLPAVRQLAFHILSS